MSEETTSSAQDTGAGGSSATTLTKDAVFKAITPVIDPELFISIVDLGLIYDAEIVAAEDGIGSDVIVKMTLTSPGCPAGPQLLSQTHAAVQELPGVREVRVDLVWTPAWNPVEMASEDAKEKLGIW